MKTETLTPFASPKALNPFDRLAHTPAAHFRLVFYAAVLRLLAQVIEQFDTAEALNERFPFLIDYNNELAEFGLQGMTIPNAIEWWEAALAAWEETAQPGPRGESPLPLCDLRQAAGFGSDAMLLWISAGLIEEDARFGAVYELLHGISGQPRPTLGLLQGWGQPSDEGAPTRRVLQHLLELGLLEVTNPDAPRLEWGLQVPALVWDALHGDAEDDSAPRLPLTSWLIYQPASRLLPLEELILPEGLREKANWLPGLLADGEVSAVIVRGPQHNGRRTLLGALARALGRGMLEIQAEAHNGQAVPPAGDQRGGEQAGVSWRTAGPLATLLHAVPVITLDLLPGERADLPELPGYHGPVGVVLGMAGAVSGPLAEQAASLMLEMPGPAERARHWASSPGVRPADVSDLADCFRLTGGNILRAARLARSAAALQHRAWIELGDVRQAGRSLNRQTLETLAQPLEPLESGPSAWGLLAADAHTQSELLTLEARCRHRERLAQAVGGAFGRQLNCGVRALFSGPSGTGKTLAARLLAGALQKDLYRLDLSAVVNKYIGETEKNLSQVFARAEELDVVLLIDEGDALLTQRTAVSTANDRYANLETNYLLQRIEGYQGILIVTTNAADRIDSAFQRRMDVMVEFRAPDAAERYAIWQLHLPPTHRVDLRSLQETAVRCMLNGGQIRNAVLHAALLALQDGSVISGQHLYAAIAREYRKMSAACPLPLPGRED